MKPSVEVHHLVGKLSTAETLLSAVQREVATCPGSFLVLNICNQGKTLSSPCRLMHIITYYLFVYGLFNDTSRISNHVIIRTFSGVKSERFRSFNGGNISTYRYLVTEPKSQVG